MKQFDELEARLVKAKDDYQHAVDGLDKDLKGLVSADAKLLRKAQHFQQQYAANPHTLKLAVAEQPGAEQVEPVGPTLEEYVAAGYAAEGYPPYGYAEVPSAGLTALREVQAKDAADGGEPRGDQDPAPENS